MSAGADRYLLGSGQHEQARLVSQAGALDSRTRRMLISAGLSLGMRVLDVGTGMGDVALLVRELIGPSGQITALDRDPATIAAARLRAAQAGIENIEFVVAELATFAAEHRFDAIVGRLVLVHQPDIALAVTRLAGLVRPGGIMAFLEAQFDSDCTDRFWPPGPPDAVDDFYGLIHRLLVDLGLTQCAGPKLVHALSRFGTVATDGVVDTGMLYGDSPELELDLAFLQSLLPRAVAAGIVASGAVKPDLLEQQVRAALAARPRARMSGMFDIAVWTTLKTG